MSIFNRWDEIFEYFEDSKGKVDADFKYPDNILYFFNFLYTVVNSNYEDYCKDYAIDPYDPPTTYFRKDPEGKYYLEIVAPDDKTKILITQDDYNYRTYKGITGTKYTESQVSEWLDHYQKMMLFNSHLPKRFLNEEVIEDKIPPIDLNKELEIDLMILYRQKSFLLSDQLAVRIGAYDEPENERGTHNKKIGVGTIERINPVIPYADREKELLKYGPMYRFEYHGKNTGKVYKAFVYNREDVDRNGHPCSYTMAIVEPESGLGYQLLLNMGPNIDSKNIDSIYLIILKVIEAEEKVIMWDDAIIRKSHTTMEAFEDNIKSFLNNASSVPRMKDQIQKSYDVYRK
jgi:hypothetical protein